MENLTVYARVASGYRPGGPNVFPIGLAGTAPSNFKDDTVVSGDLGVRAELLDHRLALDLSAFDIHWHDIQLVGLIELANGMQTTLTQNGGTAQSRGIEWQGTWAPLGGLTFSLNGAFTDARLTQDTTPEVGGFNGDPLPYVPRWTSTADIDYEFPVGADMKAYAGAVVAYVGKQRTQFNPLPPFAQIELDSYTTLDLRAGLRRSRWSVEVYCKNIADQRGITGLGTNSSGNVAAVTSSPFPQTAFIIRPRTVGLNLTARF
jgi:outer membrane receptor protein involved in Fe transport